ncbi:TlpA disulfide reductase family protein [Novosphingobium colocasiae]|uniref:TlpA disulfide reductase family protein n=1 Tax=Novosphingobium colocasiae TaxID=1256513 RepID=UPI0035B2F77B
MKVAHFPFMLACAGMLIAAAVPATLPALRVTTITGTPVELKAGKVVVVNYWATWCAPCRIEMPMLDAAYARFHGSGVEMIGIALDTGASREKVRRAMHVSFPLARLADTSIKPSQVPGALPETRIYGRDGRLRYTFRAGKDTLDGPTLDRILATLSAER